MAQEQKELDMVDRDPNGINSHVKVRRPQGNYGRWMIYYPFISFDL